MKLFIVLNILIAIVIIIRTLSRDKISRRARYAMWVSIPVYLLLSFFAFQVISLPLPKKIQKIVSVESYTQIASNDIPDDMYTRSHPISERDTLAVRPATADNSVTEATDNIRTEGQAASPAVQRTSQTAAKKSNAREFLSVLSKIGSIVLAVLILTSNVIFLGKIRLNSSYYGKAPYGNLRVYRTVGTGSPFLLGRDIFISKNIREGSDAYRFAVCHEYCHYKQGDSIWLIAEYLILCLYWYDPLIWYARKLMREDRELSVDERVLDMLGYENRSKYSMTLLRFFRGITESDPVMNIATTMSNKNRPFIKRRIIGIMNGTRKSMAVTVIVAIMLSVTVGCSLFKTAPSGKGEKISADTPWYYCDGIECAREYDNYNFSAGSRSQRVIGKIPSGYVYEVQGEIRNDSRDFFDTTMLDDLVLYSETGDLIARMDLREVFTSTFPNEYAGYTLERFVPLCIDNGEVKLYRQSSVDNMLKTYSIDIASGTITETESRALSVDFYNTQASYSTRCGDYVLFTSVGSLAFTAYDKDGNRTDFSTVEESWRDYPRFITPPIAVSDHEVLFGGYEDYTIWCYDIEANTLTKIEDDNDEYSWIYSYILSYAHESLNPCLSSDGTTYFLSENEIFRLDTENKQVESIVLFENMDLNRNWITRALFNVQEIQDDNIVFTVQTVNDTGFTIYTATPADQNPNAGKTIITTDGSSESVYDAVYLFNNTDEDYFVRIVPYAYYEESWGWTDSDLPIEIASLYSDSEVGNKMLVDLIAGDCPDVVFYGTFYEQINNGNCMLDLSTYYESSDLKNDVFDNIVSACYKNGGLYSFPLNFNVMGISIDTRYYDHEGRGMSFSDFYDFTYGYCNGTNALSQDQFGFINTCIENNLDLFICGNSANFDCDAFRQIAEFTYDNVYNDTSNDYLIMSRPTELNYPGAWLYSVDQYSSSYDNFDVVGYPSPDGRSIGARICESVSITKDASDPEGAWRFISMLCNSDIQRLEASPLSRDGASNISGSFFPINKEALNLVIEDTVLAYNARINEQYYTTNNQNAPTPLEIEDFDKIKDIVYDIDHIMSYDRDIELIIYEEIQPYLCGDKTLDEVIDIINDRAQLVIEERS